MATHAHFSGEFGAQKMTKKLEKDPAYRAARAQHFAREAHAAHTAHAASASTSDKAKHALVIEHATQMAAKHGKAAQRLAPGSEHAAMGKSAMESAKNGPPTSMPHTAEHANKTEIPSQMTTLAQQHASHAARELSKTAYKISALAQIHGSSSKAHMDAASAHDKAAKRNAAVGNHNIAAEHQDSAVLHKSAADHLLKSKSNTKTTATTY